MAITLLEKAKTVHQNGSLDNQQRTVFPSQMFIKLSTMMFACGCTMAIANLTTNGNLQSSYLPYLVLDSELKEHGNFSQDQKQLHLRVDWTNQQPHSDLARMMIAHQNNCSLPLGSFKFRDGVGLGSDLHLWGQALCNGMQFGLRLRTLGNWVWMDKESCRQAPTPMLCYFKASELTCPEDIGEHARTQDFDFSRSLSDEAGRVARQCYPLLEILGLTLHDLRMSATEFLFLHVSSGVVQEAERQLNLVFAGHDEVPQNLITVHVRWGDKSEEMDLVEITKYVDAVKSIVDRRTSLDGRDDEVNVYLATEDPEAIQQFDRAMPKTWNLFVDHGSVELLNDRIDEYSGHAEMARKLDGRPGLVFLGSLLVAMESNDFVLTTGSNWSRLMDELRKGLLDPICDFCTTMIDLRPGQW